MDPAALAAWRALLAAHATVVAAVESALADAELPPLAWYDVLWPLRSSDDRRLRMNELNAQVTLSRTGLTRLVDRIERAGLLRREPVPHDRRGTYVVITPAGTAMLRRMWPVYERELEGSFAAHLTGARTVERVLGRIAGAGKAQSSQA